MFFEKIKELVTKTKEGQRRDEGIALRRLWEKWKRT